MLLVPAKKQKTPACIREIQVHKLWTNVYSQQGLTAMVVCVCVCLCVCVCVRVTLSGWLLLLLPSLMAGKTFLLPGMCRPYLYPLSWGWLFTWLLATPQVSSCGFVCVCVCRTDWGWLLSLLPNTWQGRGFVWHCWWVYLIQLDSWVVTVLSLS